MFLNNSKRTNEDIKINIALQHFTYNNIMKYKEALNICDKNLEIITIVRNPYERIISDLFCLYLIKADTPKEKMLDIIRIYLFENENCDNHNIPQHLFVTNNKKELIENIKILHTETLKKDMINLGYSDFNVKINCNRNKIDYYSYLNNDCIKLINEYYDYDFKLFNYEKIVV